MLKVCTADAVAYIIDLRSLTNFLRYHIIEVVAQELDCRSCSKVRATNANYKEHF